MWEDTGAWNSYADDTSGGGFTAYDSGDNGWGQNDSWGGNVDSWWQQNPASSWGAAAPPPPPPSGGSWTGPQPQYTPGNVNNPSISQITSGNPTVSDLADRMGGMEGATFYRNQDPMNPQLANAEHNLFTRYMLSNPILNTTGVPQAVSLAAPVGYGAAKMIAQNLPPWLRAYMPSNLVNATPPSWEQVWSGIRPVIFGR